MEVVEIAINVLKFLLFVFVTFFTCQVVTNNNKRISYVGTILICFSSAIIEYINSGLLEAILCCELIFISINKLLEETNCSYLHIIAIPVRNFRFFNTFK